jgi:hypothetical protein
MSLKYKIKELLDEVAMLALPPYRRARIKARVLDSLMADPGDTPESNAEAIAKFRHRIGMFETQNLHWEFSFRRYYFRADALARELWGPPDQTTPPPKEIPPELMDAFTMGGLATIDYNWLDCTFPANHPLIYTDREIDNCQNMIRSGTTSIYGTLDVWTNEAMKKYPLAGLSVVNMGSLTPWYEAMILLNGGRSTTIDYNKIITRTDRIRTMTVAEFEGNPEQFDYGVSLSSFEHDGLGMYGDPLDPDGDLKAMRKMKTMLKKGAYLLLAVPTGKDRILFNNARIYGRHRLPRLMEGWEWIDSWGYFDNTFDGDGSAQPLYVLKNT